MSTNFNKTTNGTQTTSCFDPTARRIGYTVTYSLISVVSVIANLLIAIIFYKTKTLRKSINFFIVNMAISDILLPIFLITPYLTSLYTEDPWLISGPVGVVLCKLVMFLPHVSVSVSTESLVLIAMDRFVAVVFPLRSPLISSRLCPFLILVTWIVAMAVSFPYLLTMKLVEYPDGLVCERKWIEAFGDSSSLKLYNVTVFTVSFYVPFVLIAILYIIICLRLKLQKKPGEPSINIERQRARRERNVLKMSVAIVFGFALCWFPYTIHWLLPTHFRPENASCGFEYFTAIAFLLAHSNCAINPCICFIFSVNYRQGFKNLTRGSLVFNNDVNTSESVVFQRRRASESKTDCLVSDAHVVQINCIDWPTLKIEGERNF